MPLTLLLAVGLFVGLDRFSDWQADRDREKQNRDYNACYVEAQIKGGLQLGTAEYDAYVDRCHAR